MIRATLTGSGFEKLQRMLQTLGRVPQATQALIEATGNEAVAQYQAGFAAQRSPYGDSWGRSLYQSGALSNPKLVLRPGGWILRSEERYAFIHQHGWIPGRGRKTLLREARQGLGKAAPGADGRRARRSELSARVRILRAAASNRVEPRQIQPEGKDAGLWEDPICGAGRAAVLKVFEVKA